MNVELTIKNLDSMSQALSRAANSPKNFNTAGAHYLELMSFELHRNANELRFIESQYGISHAIITEERI